MKYFLRSLIIAGYLSISVITMVFAQTEQLTLKISRDFGYAGFNNDIQGLYSMKVTGPTDLARVVFYIDDKKIGEVTKAPYNLQFNTDNYPFGVHDLKAVGYSMTQAQYTSNLISRNFVPASVGNKAGLQIAIPVLIIVFGAILLSFVIPMIGGRRKMQELPLGASRNYGLSGGICPKCSRPFALPVFSLNLGLSKLAKCPFCGKWSSVRIQPLVKLREAEQAELGWGKPDVIEESDEEKLRKNMEDSRYQ